jgi:hypothetical protein
MCWEIWNGVGYSRFLSGVCNMCVIGVICVGLFFNMRVIWCV